MNATKKLVNFICRGGERGDNEASKSGRHHRDDERREDAVRLRERLAVVVSPQSDADKQEQRELQDDDDGVRQQRPSCVAQVARAQ